jgi:PAS domain S-box-containing protein
MERAERESSRLIDGIPGPIVILTKKGDVDTVNRHLLEYFGTTIEKASQWGTNDLVHPEDLPHLVELFAGSIEAGTPYESELRLRRWDGVYRWFRACASPLRDSNSQIVRWCVLLTDIDERKRAEDALRASERNLKSIIDTIPALAWSARTDGSAEFLNRHYLDYTGLSAEQASGWNWTAAIHPEDLGGLTAAWQRIMASQEPGEAEARIRRFDGSYRWHLFRTNPLRDESGNVVKWYGTNLDIEDRKRGEETLRASELSWRQIVDNIPGLVATMGAAGDVEFLNRQTLEYFGKTAEDLKNWSLIGVVHPEDLPQVIEARIRSVETGQAYDVEHRCLGADGVYRWFQVRGLPVRNAEGAITTWYLLLTDIDDRKKAEAALQASERNLSLIINTIPTHLYVLNTEGFVQYVNQAVMEYTGLSLEDATQEDYRDRVIHPEDFKRVRAGRAASLGRGAPFSTEQRVLGSDGQYRWFLVRYNPLLDEHGRIDRWYVAATDIEDRKRAEQALQQTQVYLSEGQRLAHMGSWAFNAAGFDYWSPELLGVYGLDPGSKPPTIEEYLDFVHPEDREFMEYGIRKMLDDHLAFDFTKRIVRSSGETRYIRYVGVPVVDDAGFKGFVGTGMDVTEQERLLQKLRQSEQDLRTIIDTIRQIIVVLAPDGTTLYANQVAFDFTGLSAGEMDGEEFLARACHSEDLDRVNARRRAGMSEGVPFETEGRFLYKRTHYRWVLMQYNPLKDDQGRIVRWYATATDIDDRKRAEAQVEQAYLRLAEAQRLSKTGSFITDLQADEHNWSEETFRIFEFDPSARVTVLMIRDVVHPEDLPSFDAVIARGIAGEEVDFLFRIVTSRGAVKHIRGMARILAQSAGRPLFIGALQDVTDSKIAAEALEKARSELTHVSRVTTLNALTGSIAHEINQPLSGIITNAGTCLRMLEGDPPNIDGARETVRRTLRDGNRAADVISRLRSLFSKKEFALEPLDLNEATREVIALSLSDLQRNRVTLRAELAENLPPVIGDRVQLQQVILNLLRNASDAMAGLEERPRDLRIRTLPEGDDRARLSVQDTGIGVPSQDLQKLFEPFYTTKNGGMGIGLSVSHSIIERHQGRLWAEANDGPGATFSFSIPCSPNRIPSAALR